MAETPRSITAGRIRRTFFTASGSRSASITPAPVVSQRRTRPGAKAISRAVAAPIASSASVSSVPTMRRSSSRRSGAPYSLKTGTSAEATIPLISRS